MHGLDLNETTDPCDFVSTLKDAYFCRLIEEPRVIYLDVDVIVQGDLAELWRQPTQSDTLIAVVQR